MFIPKLELKKSQISFTSIFWHQVLHKNTLLKSKFSPRANLSLSSCIRINFVSNNIYCTFWSVSGKRTFRVRSAGMKMCKPAKKRLFFYGKLFLESFFQELQQWRQKYRQKNSFFFFSLKVPKRFRKIILKYIARKSAIINFEYAKAFNGCKARKKRRKKRLGFRSFK